MNDLKTLVKMQLNDKLRNTTTSSTKDKVIGVLKPVLKFAIFTIIIYALFFALSFLNLVSLSSSIPLEFFSLVLGMLFVLSLIVSVLSLSKHLYFAKDNLFLLTLPVNKTKVYISKMIVFVLYELYRNIFYFLPLLLTYGIINKIMWAYFIWIIPATLIITLFIVAISALISIPYVYVSRFIKDHKILQIAFNSILVIGATIVVFMLISVIPQDINLVAQWSTIFFEVQDVLKQVATRFPFFYYLSYALVGGNLGSANLFFNLTQALSLLTIIGITITFALGAIFALKPLFFSMANKLNEHRGKNATIQKPNKKRNSFFTEVFKEFTLSIRETGKLTNLLIVAIGLPLSILLLNKVFGAMDVRLEGRNMIWAFNILLILLVALASNASLAKTFSEDGKAAYLIKTSPSKYIKPITARTVLNFSIVTTSIIASVIIFGTTANLNISQTISALVLVESLYIGHMLNSVLYDIMNPQNEHYASAGSHPNNPNENRSTITSFVIAGIFGFLIFFFAQESFLSAFWKVLIFAVLYLGIALYNYINKINIYYKEL